jgi:hypothetical protein
MAKLNPLFDKEVEMAMRRTIDAIGYDLQEMYEDGIIPKADAREMVLDADRIHMYGKMDPLVTSYYKEMSHTHKMKLVKKAIPLDLC